MTNLCNHIKGTECPHCLDGCEKCGKIEDLNDDLLCEDCTQSHAEYLADLMHDQMKYGE
jgi:hypothetical protein